MHCQMFDKKNILKQRCVCLVHTDMENIVLRLRKRELGVKTDPDKVILEQELNKAIYSEPCFDNEQFIIHNLLLDLLADPTIGKDATYAMMCAFSEVNYAEYERALICIASSVMRCLGEKAENHVICTTIINLIEYIKYM